MSEKPSISKINQDYWEKAASTYDAEPWKKEVARKLTLEIASRAKWIGLPKQEQTDRPLRVLDYGRQTPTSLSLASASPSSPFTTSLDLSLTNDNCTSSMWTGNGLFRAYLPHEKVVVNLRAFD
ncbi:hypothetical protein MMC25_002468 [Agyrium rufum]|nr:hypothetical protein [Agyrium rufum]